MLVICEGESDATVASYCLESLGLQERAFATGVTKGSGQKPEPALLRELAAKGIKGILVVPDADEPGQRWAEAWAAAARQAGLLAQVFDLGGSCR